MAVQSIPSEDLFEGLPSLIGLPRCVPERPSYRKTPFREVCVPEELPPYLLLGNLDRSAFRSTEDGWSARWNGDTPETFVEARYERATKQLQLHQVWRGINGGTSYTTCDDARLGIQMLYMPFPEIWDQGLAQRLESAYRLKYLPGRDQCGFTGIPDGGFKTIGVPVPIHKLADVRACLDDLACDPEFRVPMGGRLDLRFGTVNHVTGRGPEWTEDPERLYVASFEASGFLPLGLPQLEHANDGSSAWTVRRLVYLASIEVPFAGVEFVVERLAEFGLVRRHGAGESAEPGVEFDAFVAPAGIELTSQSISWMDAQGARRVFYLLNSGDEPAKGDATRMMEALEQSAEDAVELIRQAVLVSGQQKRWLASLMRCEECEA